MAHMVKCITCGERFDRDKIEHTQVSPRRYAHKKCYVPESKVNLVDAIENEHSKIMEYIKQTFKENANYMLAGSQIKEYKEKYNYTYSGMLKALQWWYDIKGNEKVPDKAHGGVGIIPYIYEDAYKFFYSVHTTGEENEKILETYQPVTKEIIISSPEVFKKPPRMFNAEDDE